MSSAIPSEKVILKDQSPALLTPLDLERFIDVYGNFRKFYFLAIRFKRPVIKYINVVGSSAPIEPLKDCILFIGGKCPPIQLNNVPFLLFTSGSDYPEQAIRVSNSSEETLLRSLVPCNFLYSIYYSHTRTLFMITLTNPFLKYWVRGRRDKAFHALYELTIASLFEQRPLTPQEASYIRFFHRNKGPDQYEHFNAWNYLARHICYNSFVLTVNCFPSADLGKEIFHILERSEKHYGPLPPSDFYQCELLLDDSKHLGIMVLISDQTIKYVSPMVVVKPNMSFRDCNSIICNTWLPLYRNFETWNTYGLAFYLKDLRNNQQYLADILSLLNIHTVEKYKFMYSDLLQIAHILLGEKSRWFLKN